MRYDERKLNWKNLLLIVALVSVFVSCDKPPKITPHVIDTDLMECREYEIIDHENFIIKFKESHPITKCNGYYSISAEEMANLKQYWLEQIKDCKDVSARKISN